MAHNNIISNIKRYHKRLNGSTIEYDLTKYRNILESIKRLRDKYENISDDEIANSSKKLINRARGGEPLDSLLHESFAIVNEAIRRVLRLNPFDVQLIGGIAMHNGKLAEMQTGEGKTLTAVFPVYVNALDGKGVHVLTFNDYLAQRDAQWMGPIYNYLGLSVGYVKEGMSIKKRKEAYSCDITYLTAKEAGFDFLRDSICYNTENIVQREFNYALVDEADSILIDEARVPLIIAGVSDDEADKAEHNIAEFVKRLKEKVDYEFDEYMRNIQLTDQGANKIEKFFGFKNLYDEENSKILSSVNCALHAEFLLQKNIDYIIRNGKAELVDEFTGRVADKRRFPDGLQEAIESKENLKIQSKGKILNSITLQHFLRLYPKICGMTATAEQAENEFKEFYNLDIVVIPPNRPCIRIDYPDVVFPTKEEKYNALIEEIISVHKTQRPILVGTRSVEDSSQLGSALNTRGINCEILNAKRDEHEARIIANAGLLGALTISTNMAGRGTDVRLGGDTLDEKKEVMSLGGLYVIGTNRHESRRIDNQLRGRAGRQGDPGSSRFFISQEDDLFIKYRLQDLLPSHKTAINKIENKIITREINRIQRIIEGQNFEIKKTLYNYSSQFEQQRKIIHDKRNNALFQNTFADCCQSESSLKFDSLRKIIGKEKLNELCRNISLYYLDKYWSEFLSEIASVREGIHLTRFGGENPQFVFRKISIDMFDQFLEKIDKESIALFNSINIENNEADLTGTRIKIPAATWTYLIDDNPFENTLEIAMAGNIGLSSAVSFMWPLLLIYAFAKSIKRKREEKYSNR